MNQLTSDMISNSGINVTPMQNQPGNVSDAIAIDLIDDSSERDRWSVAAIQALLDLPFNDLIHRA